MSHTVLPRLRCARDRSISSVTRHLPHRKEPVPGCVIFFWILLLQNSNRDTPVSLILANAQRAKGTTIDCVVCALLARGQSDLVAPRQVPG